MRQTNRQAGGAKPMPTLDRLAGLRARLQVLGIHSQPVLELPYTDWLKLHAALEHELAGRMLHVGGITDPLVTRGQWFHCAGVKVRSCG